MPKQSNSTDTPTPQVLADQVHILTGLSMDPVRLRSMVSDPQAVVSLADRYVSEHPGTDRATVEAVIAEAIELLRSEPTG